MINIKTQRGERQQQRELVLMMERIEKSWSIRLAKIIKLFYIDAAEEIEKGFLGRIEWSVDKRVPELIKLFKIYYKIIGLTFFRKLFKDYRKAGYEYYKKAASTFFDDLDDLEMGPIEDRYWKVFGDWSRKQMGKKIQIITGTAKKKITKMVSDMMKDENYSYREMAKAIKEKSKLSMFEAIRIARTESHSAAVFSTQSAVDSTAKETGVEFKKYWLNAIDDRTRTGHIAAGETYGPDSAIGMEEPYLVAAIEGDEKEELMHPGDPSGSPGNIINCRCVELYTQ